MLDLAKLSQSRQITEDEKKKVEKFIEKLERDNGFSVPVLTEGETVNSVQREQENTYISTNVKNTVLDSEQQGIGMSIASRKGRGVDLVQDEKKDNDLSTATEKETDLDLFQKIINPDNTIEQTLKQTQIFIDSGYSLEEHILYYGRNFLHGLISQKVDIQAIEVLMGYRRIGINDWDGFWKCTYTSSC